MPQSDALGSGFAASKKKAVLLRKHLIEHAVTGEILIVGRGSRCFICPICRFKRAADKQPVNCVQKCSGQVNRHSRHFVRQCAKSRFKIFPADTGILNKKSFVRIVFHFSLPARQPIVIAAARD
ncbi:hypothetical protein [Duodenibacillus massiliensis]|uniref:hypothetical protein n=1 Tax=Duodenibacillus massiliensis TaxID=1852381 RepID=UPI003F810466